MEKKIKELIEEIRPMLQSDGGDLHYISFDKKTGLLKVELLGACVHCPMAEITLKKGIEEKIRKEIPEVKEVMNIN
jgi:Fe-S cluster biogenesis protein NfuA